VATGDPGALTHTDSFDPAFLGLQSSAFIDVGDVSRRWSRR
jgi:hypothetical protein